MPALMFSEQLSVAKTLALSDQPIAPDVLAALLRTPSSQLDALLDAAYEVRYKYFGRTVRLQVLSNAKSGHCEQDCGYCAQSKVSKAAIEKYPLKSLQHLLDEARQAHDAGAGRFCIVTSGGKLTERDLLQVCEAVEAIRNRWSLEICCSVGQVTAARARALRQAGATWVNHNLNTSQSYYSSVCSTHRYEDRLQTIDEIRAAGLQICAGGIIGMGESLEQRVELALACRQKDANAIPVNFYYPVKETPLEKRRMLAELTPQDCLKTLCMFRFANPTKELRLGAGRERYLGHLQPLALKPANALFVEGYLTTAGDSAESTKRMILSAGFDL